MEERDKKSAANLKCVVEANKIGAAAIEAALQRGMFGPGTVAKVLEEDGEER